MEYVEFLRIRKSLLWHLGFLALIALAFVALGHDTTVNVDAGGAQTHLTSGMAAPLGVLASVGAVFAAIFASTAGTSLNRESGRRDISWTKPLARTVVALRYVLIDLAGVAVAFAATMLAVVAVVIHFHITPFFDAQAPAEIALALGVGVMWYGLVQALTFWFGPAARSVSGILWPVALVLGGLHTAGGIAGDIARSIDVINPLSYLSNTSFGSNDMPARGVANLVGPAPLDLRLLTVWFFALLFCALAIVMWPRKEA